jgi:hypothetical protein
MAKTYDVAATVRLRVTAASPADADVHVLMMAARKLEEMKDSPAVLSTSVRIIGTKPISQTGPRRKSEPRIPLPRQ